MKMRFSTILSEKTIRRATLILTAAVLTTLTACRNNETHRTRLTNTEMDSYGKAIAGQYEGSYIILWSNSTMPWHETEDGRKVRENVRETVEDVSITVTDNTLRSIAFHKFPIRMLSHIVEGNEALQKALAEVPDMDLTARYGWDLYTDELSPIWGMEDMMTPLTLTYGGQEHTIILKFRNDTRQLLDKTKLEGSKGFSQVSTLQLSFDELRVDGELVQKDESWETNSGELLAIFRMKQ
ncbi:MAG: DUF4840 domain-containing protein [Bacteroidaceae bacterium]|nr:DUF4840 domain-containing protein [Bacteroidaceae bacterium]